MAEPVFLRLADVVRIHVDQMQRYGGHPGIRDLGQLASAMAMPPASFGGEWLHKGRRSMAAAYSFHLHQNHPFVEGNKRTALACALVFLDLNGIAIEDPEGRLYQAMIDITSGSLDKAGLAQVFTELPNDT